MVDTEKYRMSYSMIVGMGEVALKKDLATIVASLSEMLARYIAQKKVDLRVKDEEWENAKLFVMHLYVFTEKELSDFIQEVYAKAFYDAGYERIR